MRKSFILLLISAMAVSAQDKIDLSILSRIKREAFQNSQVMDDLFYLTDVYGPRLTNSPGHRQAADWVMKRLKEYGLENVHEESWGPFGQSWKLTYFSAHLLEPQYQTLIGFPLAWTPGTAGDIKAEPVMAVINTEADFEKFKGKLKGQSGSQHGTESDRHVNGAAGKTFDGRRARGAGTSARSITSFVRRNGTRE